MDLVNPPAKDPKMRRRGDLAARSYQAYAFYEHSHTTPEINVLFPAIHRHLLDTLPAERMPAYGLKDTT